MAKVQKVIDAEVAKSNQFNIESYNAWVAANDGLAKGKVVYDDNCLSCHAEGGAGDIGPNMTDNHWINIDGTVEGMYAFIIVGNEEMGMPAWGEMLSKEERSNVARWQAGRFDGGHDLLPEFEKTGNFDEFHTKLTKLDLHKDRQLEVIYDPALTLSKIQSELDKLSSQLDIGVVIVDYLNQVKRHNAPSRSGQYDWTEQIEVSKKMKLYAQEYETMFFAPYQTDSTGEARFAKGILDAADAAYSLETWEQDDECMTFNCVKMRSNEMKSFSSVVDWETLKIGPQSQINPKEREAMESSMKTGEDVDDL